jgi:hypothetical protein
MSGTSRYLDARQLHTLHIEHLSYSWSKRQVRQVAIETAIERRDNDHAEDGDGE